MTVPGGRVALGGRDPVSCTTFNQIRVPRILETKHSRIPVLFLAIFTSESSFLAIFTRHGLIFALVTCHT